MSNGDIETGFIIGRAESDRARADAAHAKRSASRAQDRVDELERQVLSLREQNRQSRSAAAGKDAVRRRLAEALAEVAPNHPLVNPMEGNPLRNKIYDEASQREYDRNTPGAYDL